MKYELLFEEFDELRVTRWHRTEDFFKGVEGIDELLADLANIATMAYVLRKASIKPKGFQSNAEEL